MSLIVKWIKYHKYMSSLPPAIFFINGDITYPAVPPPTPPYFIGANPTAPNSDAGSSELTNLQSQLFINDTMTKAEFDARVEADPNYPTIVHLQGLRILVIVPSYNDGYHRHIDIPNIELADVVMFLHQGLADIEKNHFGPPGQNYDIQRITMYSILRAADSHAVVTLPFSTLPHCDSCNYPFFCDRCHTFSGIRICSGCDGECKCGCDCGIVDQQGIRQGIIYAPNCDNEYHNRRFIHRK